MTWTNRLVRGGLTLLSLGFLASSCSSFEPPAFEWKAAQWSDLDLVTLTLHPYLETDHHVSLVVWDASLRGKPGSVGVVVAVPKQESASEDENSYRELLVIRQLEQDRYQIEAVAKRALAPYGWDEHFPDSLSGIEVNGQAVEVTHYGGGRQRWARTDRYLFDEFSGEWFLKRVELVYSDSQNPDAEGESWVLTDKNFGEVRLVDHDLRRKPGEPAED